MSLLRGRETGQTIHRPLKQAWQDDSSTDLIWSPGHQPQSFGAAPQHVALQDAPPPSPDADPTGQLWFGEWRFLTANPASYNRVAHIDSDGNGLAGFANPAGSTDHFYASVGVDSAAGYYFAISEIINGDANTALEVRGTGSNTLAQSLLLNPNDYTVGAIAVDTLRHYIYIGVWGDSAADTGIIKLGYDPATGHIQDPSTNTDITTIFNGSVIDSKYYVVSEAGSYAATNPMEFSFDQANNKLYLAANDQDFSSSGVLRAYPGYPATNGIYVVDLSQATPTTTLLTTNSSQFPTDFSGDRITSVAYDAAKGLVYFESTNANGGGNVHLWYVSASGGTAHEIDLSATGVDATHGIQNGDLALDPIAQTLYLGTTDAGNVSRIYKLVLSADGHSIASSSNFFSATYPEAGTWGMDFTSLPVLSVTGTSQEVVQGGAGQTLLSGVTISDSDSGFLAGATIVITDGQTGDSFNADLTGTNIGLAYDTSTHTLTLTGYDTLAHYQQVLAGLKLVVAGTDTSVGSHPTRTVSWTVSDGTTLTSPTGSDPNHGSTIIVVDRPPTGVDSTNAVLEGGTVSQDAAHGVLVGASDLDGDAFSVSELSAGDVGVLSATAFGHITLYADGHYTYVADQTSVIDSFANDANLVDFIDFSISDGLGGVTSLELQIAVDQTPKVVSVEADAVSGADLSQSHTVTLTYTFGKNVDATGATALHLSDSGVASYGSGSGSKVLSFGYDTTALSSSGVAVSSVSGGGFADAAGNAVPLADTTVTDFTLTVSDTAAHVSAFLDSLESHAGGITTIALTDGGVPVVDVTAAQLTGDADALALIQGPYELHVTDGAGTAPDTGASITPPHYSSYDLYYENFGTLDHTVYNNDDGTKTFVGTADTITIDDSASTHNDYFDLSASFGLDVTGGSGSDGFYFGGAFSGDTIVDGGGGTLNQIGLDGDYSGGVVLDGSRITNIQEICFLPGNDYTVTTQNLLSAGQTMLIWAAHLGSGDVLDFDGSTETNGLFKVMGGAAGDTIKTGSGNDWIYGLGGADVLTGGAGADRFVYLHVSDSTSNAHDQITDFDFSVDKFDLPSTVSVTGVDATVVGGTLAPGADFDSQLATAVASLGAHHAILFEPDSGDFAHRIFLVVDANGSAGYQSGQDFVFDVTGASNLASLATTTFI